MKPSAALFLALRVLLGAVFVVSGFQKLTAPWANFAAVIETYEVLPAALVPLAAQVMPWLEFLAGVFFVLGLWTAASGLLLWAMNSGFIVLLASALIRRLPIEQCGCFGEAMRLSVPQMLALDAVFWGLFLLFFLLGRRAAPSLDRRLHG